MFKFMFLLLLASCTGFVPLTNKTSVSLRDEISRLETDQSDQEFALYEKVVEKFTSDKERLSFLKLNLERKKRWIHERGWISSDASVKYSFRPPQKRKIYQGMPKDEVLTSLGEPLEREVAGHPSNENERWTYSYHGATKYIYFEHGVVDGWE